MRNVERAALQRPMVLQRGTLADRPWSATLAAIGLVGRSGQLTLRAEDGKTYQLAFAHGTLIGAASPLPVDTVPRIALSSQLVSPAAVATATRILGRHEDLDRFGDTAGLTPGQMYQLKRRVIIQRVARTFAVDRGKYTVDDRVTIPVLAGVEVDVRAAIYTGMRLNLSQQRLTADLRTLGSRFVLRPEAAAVLPRFEFGPEEQPILDALVQGTSIAEIEALHRELDPRMVAAVIGALASSDAIAPVAPLATGSVRSMAPRPAAVTVPVPIRATGTQPPRGLTPATAPALTRSPTPREPTVTRTPTPREPTVTRTPTPREAMLSCVPAAYVDAPSASIEIDVSFDPDPEPPAVLMQRASSTSREPAQRSLTDPFLEAQPTMMRPPALSLVEVQQLIASRVALLEQGADHFTFLGLPFGATAGHVRAAYLELARYLRPEKLAELGITDASYEARSVYAQAVIAFTVLTDPARRAEYVSMVRNGNIRT
ncbi:MAG: hypothetical protein M3680_05860 [Myxococcota bacterium]|nr:hypothetical protein [Myxococcota bacterium]